MKFLLGAKFVEFTPLSIERDLDVTMTISFDKSLGSLPVTVKHTEMQILRIYFTVPASSFGHGSVPHNLADLYDIMKGDVAAVLEEVVVRVGGGSDWWRWDGRGMGEHQQDRPKVSPSIKAVQAAITLEKGILPFYSRCSGWNFFRE
ncbi:hypothetical protein ACFX2G_047908 [Malus domestica]